MMADPNQKSDTYEKSYISSPETGSGVAMPSIRTPLMMFIRPAAAYEASPTIPRAAPVAFLGTRSTAMRPPMKLISTPMEMPKRTIAVIFTNQEFPPSKNNANAAASKMP